MNAPTSPPLLPEDEPDFVRILDEALARGEFTERFRSGGPEGPAEAGAREAVERLRVRALRARAEILLTAHREYGAYVGVRERCGRGGAVAMTAVLAPQLSAVAAVVFLVLGYGLQLLGAQAGTESAFVPAGWTFLAAAVLTAVPAGTAVLRRAHARSVWHTSLRERGVLPFLREESLRGPGQDLP